MGVEPVSIPRRAGRNARLGLFAALLAGVIVVAFWPSLSSRFINEDLELPPVADPHGFDPPQLWLPAADIRGGGFQPLTRMMLRLEHACWGLDPRGYHRVSLALHAANGVLVCLLANSLLRTRASSASRQAAALAAALLFALHPLRVEAVAWVAQRGVLVAAFFLLLTVMLYIRAGTSGHARWLTAALTCYAVSLAAGPWGMTLPLVLIVLDVYPLRRLAASEAPSSLVPRITLRRVLIEKAAFIMLACAALIVGYVCTGRVSPAGLGVVDRLALVAQGFFFYLWKVMCPSGLLPIYELHLPLKLASLKYVGAAVGALLVVGAAAGLARRVPALAVATISYLLLVLSAVWLIQGPFEAAGDRYSYLASVPLMVGLGAGLVHLRQSAWPYARTAFLAAIIVGLLAACSLAVLTWRQCEVWRTPLTLWTYADNLDPRSGVVAYHRGRHFDRAGEPERAVQFYRAAVGAQPALLEAQLSLANALMAVANPKEAAAVYRRALALHPQDAGGHFELGAALAAAEEFAEAEGQLRQAIALNPADVRPRRSLGHLLMIMNRPAEAADAFRAALAVTPHDADLYYNLGRACLRAGQSAAAGAAFRQALQEDPGHRLAQQALAELPASPSDPSGARP